MLPAGELTHPSVCVQASGEGGGRGLPNLKSWPHAAPQLQQSCAWGSWQVAQSGAHTSCGSLGLDELRSPLQECVQTPGPEGIPLHPAEFSVLLCTDALDKPHALVVSDALCVNHV